jgi:hypothetical protein
MEGLFSAMPLRRPIPEPLPRREAEPCSEDTGTHTTALALRQEEEGLSPLSYEISTTGAVSVYGLGPAPVTLTYAQWRQLLEHAEELRSFLAENQNRLEALASPRWGARANSRESAKH